MSERRDVLIGWLDLVLAVDGDGPLQTAAVDAALDAIGRLSGVIEACRVRCAEFLRASSTRPEEDLTFGLRGSRRDVSGTLRRLAVIEQAPAIGQALAGGEVGAGHVDSLGGILRRLDTGARERLLDELPAVVQTATTSTVDEFDDYLRGVERQLRRDDGESALARQRAAVRLRTWVGRDDGMYHLKLIADPRTGVDLDGQLRVATETMFHGGQIPEHAPQDWMERQAFLRAHALLRLLRGERVAGGRPEIVVVEDRRVPHGCDPVIDWGVGVDLPRAELERLRLAAREVRVLLDGDEVVEAPGRMELGRSTRLASADQRRTMRALYATCAMPGCDARFDHTTAHHVVWWRPPHDGRTDLDNLVPLCSVHHHAVHEGGWVATLGADRTFTVRQPDGRVLVGRPNRLDQTRRRGYRRVTPLMTAPERAGPEP